MVYADYEYYVEKYFGTLPEDSFHSLILKASKEIDRNVNTRITQSVIDNLPEEAQVSLKYTACALADLIARKQESENAKLNSISIDGVSKNFKILSTNEYKGCRKDILKNLPDELTRFL
ncbi:MAG: hypothetical protein HFJ35_02740 [Clostridia bacterium]|nr:hypothetical protein [Clostridia bacterium]